jgi:hypothetical protein
MPKDKNIIEPINASFEEVANSMVQPAPHKTNKNNHLSRKMGRQPAPPQQYVLDIGVETQRDVNGIEMGVLENGVAYLTQTGLAELVGVARSVIFDISQDWEAHYSDPIETKDRISFIKQYLFGKGYAEPKLYIETYKDGSPHNAYPDIVCMAVLEYYAFEAKSPTKKALSSFRTLAQYGLQKFIYDALGYTPADKWKYWHDRVSINHGAAPDGYFTVFNEVAGMVVDLINADLPVNDKTIPDISVGRCWGDYWRANNLSQGYGERIEYDHNYPSYYPQALSNPQPAKAYPDAAIPAFKKWFKHEYLTTKFPKYVLTKAHLLGGQRKAVEISNIFQPKQIEKK